MTPKGNVACAQDTSRFVVDKPSQRGDGDVMRSDRVVSAPPRSPAGRMRSLTGALLVVLIPGLCACGERGPAGPATVTGRGIKPIPVRVSTVGTADLVQEVQGTGSLEAYQVVTVGARIEGVVETVAFDEGDDVDTKRELAVIDGQRRALEEAQAQAAVAQAAAAGPRTEAAIARAKAGEERARAQEGAARNDLAEAEAMLDRRVSLRRDTPGAVPEEEVATIRAQVARRRDALSVAEAQRREAEAAYAEAQAQAAESAAALTSATARLALATKAKNDTVVRSPLEGVVRRRHVTLGQYVRAGDPVAELVDRSRLRLRFRVSEAESVRLATGQLLTFLVPSLSSVKHRARLVHVDEAASPITRMVEALAEVVEPDKSLKPGFFAVATVETKQPGALAVPEAAVLPGEQGWVVYVVEDGKARRRSVAVGLRTRDGRVEIREGLAAGASIVVEGANVLSDDTPVTATPAVVPGAPPAKP